MLFEAFNTGERLILTTSENFELTLFALRTVRTLFILFDYPIRDCSAVWATLVTNIKRTAVSGIPWAMPYPLTETVLGYKHSE